jgi:hypothetical protein
MRFNSRTDVSVREQSSLIRAREREREREREVCVYVVLVHTVGTEKKKMAVPIAFTRTASLVGAC